MLIWRAIYDNYMQDPTSQQGFNRYAYCMYNPLKYVDPSGERQMGWIYSTYQWEQEARTAVTKEWEKMYEVCTVSHNLTHSMACSIYSKGTDACGGGDGGGNHGSGIGGIQVSDIGNGKYKVVGGSIGPNHSITVIDGNNAGTVIGYYLTDYSFADKDGNIVVGETIDLNDNSGQVFWDKYTNNPPDIEDYMLDIFWGDYSSFLGGYFNFKYQGYTSGNKQSYAYRGMPINFGDGFTYVTTARDIGNAYAGFIAEYNGFTYSMTRTGFNIYNGEPEPLVSSLAQDYGYFLGKNLITPRWREKIFNLYRP